MLTCAIALLLINTFYCSFGHPVNNANLDLEKSLQSLANKCGDTFLSTRIKNISETCNITLSAEKEITEQELQCLIFYDMNSQLCATLQGSKQNLTNSYISSMNQTQKVDETCNAASKNWKFSNLSDLPKYYNTSEKVFKNKLTCIKACGVKDIYSEDTNFFCKYYHWASELILVNENKTVAISEENGSTSSPQSKLNDNQRISQLETPSVTSKDDVENNSKLPPTIRKHTEQQEENDAEDGKGQKNNHSTDQNSVTNNNEVNAKNSTTKDNSTDTQANSESNHLPKKKILKHSDKPQKDDENPQTDNTNDDEGNLDGFNEDIDDSDVDPQNIPPGTSENQRNDGGISSIANGEIPQKGMYTNTMTNPFVEEDDHFFSFFLTAIILVIFFYVLYHNKSKFRKVFLGLLVEGRQPGRRRNSRGHEYRRLDTLEQAMSTNSTAPPCKIIY